MAQALDDHSTGVTGPNGEPITRDSLPSSASTRWVTSRKAQLIAAIRGGIITIEEASQRYCLTIDELSEWQASFDKHGKRGLRATFIQQYRFLRHGEPAQSE